MNIDLTAAVEEARRLYPDDTGVHPRFDLTVGQIRAIRRAEFVAGASWIAPLIEAAVREQIAGEIEARRLAYLDMPRSVVAGSMAYEDAARIARGGVAR